MCSVNQETDQSPASDVLKKVHNILISKYSTVLSCSLKRLMNRKTQFKVALKRYLNTHPFYSAEEFLMLKNDCQCKGFLSLNSIIYFLHMDLKG
jgi:hypothetical protein